MRLRNPTAALLLLATVLLLCVGWGVSRHAPGAASTAAAPPSPWPAPVTASSPEVRASFAMQLGARAPSDAPDSPLEGQLRLNLTDARTGAPVGGVRPLLWMTLREEGMAAPEPAACEQRARTYLKGLMSARADINLNAYLFLTLNDDHTVSVIDPQISFDRTKLQNLVALGGEAADWALLPDMSALYVTLPIHGSVAVVDLRRFKLTRNVMVGASPGRLAISPDGRSAWVGNEGDGTVAVLETTDHQVVATLEPGKGHHSFAFSEGGRTAWVASSEGAELLAVDVASHEVLGKVEVGAGVGSLAFSETALALFVAQERTQQVLVVDTARREVVKRIPLQAGMGRLWMDPTGRWAFVLTPGSGRVDILDTASSRVAHTLTGFSLPDQVTFTRAYAYVRNTTDARVSLIELSSLQKAETPPVVHVTMGQKKPAQAWKLGTSSPIAVLPEGDSVVVAGAADRALFLYSEGMMAPRGTHLNYGREPRAVLVVDRSMREVEPGLYTNQAVVRENGTYDVAMLLDSPRTALCLAWQVTGVPPGASRQRKLPLTLSPEFEPEAPLTAGQSVPLRFRLVPAEHVEDQRPVEAEELQVLMFRPPSGGWLARPEPRRIEEGLFEVEVTPPDPGQYRLLVGARGRDAALGVLPDFTLGVQPAPASPHTRAEVTP